MDYTQAREYLLSKPEAIEDFPFGPDVAVFKICQKMFAAMGTEKNEQGQPEGRLNLKCEPTQALMLREIFSAVVPGYHMNKKHWNTVILDGSVPQGELKRMVDHSYALVVKGLPKAKRQGLMAKYGEQVE